MPFKLSDNSLHRIEEKVNDGCVGSISMNAAVIPRVSHFSYLAFFIVDTHLREALQIIGLQKDHLSTDSQQLLSQITELAMLLGLSDTTLSNFHQGQAQLHLDTIHHTQQQRTQKVQLQALESNQRQAQQGLEELLEMKRQWREARETEVDLEQRTKRRST